MVYFLFFSGYSFFFFRKSPQQRTLKYFFSTKFLYNFYSNFELSQESDYSELFRSNLNRILKRVKSLESSGGLLPEDPNQEDPNQEDPNPEDGEKTSYLTKDLRVPGETCPFPADSIKNIPNTPTPVGGGGYAIRCKINNKHYVGESKNLKHRIKEHRQNLAKGVGVNKDFLEDYKQYGVESFELIIYFKGSSALDNNVRKKYEQMLQIELRSHNLCYNTGNSETILPRMDGEFPSSAGVYSIYCSENNTVYYGEAGGDRGVAHRIIRWKRLLSANKLKVLPLQKDWKAFGKDAFTFSVIASGPDYEDKNIRLDKQRDLIKEVGRTEGKRCYNAFEDDRTKYPFCSLSQKESILASQTPERRKAISDMNTGRSNENKTPVIINEELFLSISEAALQLGVTRASIRDLIQNKDTSIRLATEEESQLEKERREKMGIKIWRLQLLLTKNELLGCNALLKLTVNNSVVFPTLPKKKR